MPVPRMLIQRARVNNGLFMGHCVQVSSTFVVLVSQQLLMARWLLLISQAEEYGFRQGPNNMYLYIWFTADSLLLRHDHRTCFSPAILAYANGKTIPYRTVGVWKNLLFCSLALSQFLPLIFYLWNLICMKTRSCFYPNALLGSQLPKNFLIVERILALTKAQIRIPNSSRVSE